MLNFNTILFPVDFSSRCRAAAGYVRALGQRFNSRIILLHVVEPRIGVPGHPEHGAIEIDTGETARELLDSFLTRELRGLNVDRQLVDGIPVIRIIETAEAEKAGLIVIPTHGYGGFRRVIFGSLTSTVLHRSPCPVLTGAHMSQVSHTGALQIKSIVCALDLSPHSENVLRGAADLASAFGAQVVLLHVVPGGDSVPERMLDREVRSHLMNQAKRRMEAMAQGLGLDCTYCLDHGNVAEVIEAAANKYSADVLVIGRSHGDHQMWMPQHAYAIVRHSPCPVFSI